MVPGGLSTTWKSGLKRHLIALACDQMTAKNVDLSVLGEVAHHLMIHRGNDFHAVKSYASHDGVEMG